MGSFAHVDEESFNSEVIQSELPVILEFGAAWCVPCKRLEPILEELEKAWSGRVRLAKLDVDQCPELTAGHNIMTVPTVILYVNGTPVQRLTGLQTLDRLVDKLEPYL